jgi:hypothetical protein
MDRAPRKCLPPNSARASSRGSLPPADDRLRAGPTESGTALIHLVDIESLQKLQDRFTELGQVTVCICAVTGEPITTPSWGSRYSELIGTSPQGRTEFAGAIRECVEGANGGPVENRSHRISCRRMSDWR